MIAEDFDLTRALSKEMCPRCLSVGLAEPSAETFTNAPIEDHWIERVIVCPSFAAWCHACGLVGNWPAMRLEPEENHKRKRKRLSEITQE